MQATEKFRLTRATAEFTLQFIGDALSYRYDMNDALPPDQQLLLALRFYADNGFYHLTADAHGVTKATVCRTVQRVTAAIVDNMFHLVRWPADNAGTMQDFYAIGGMPRVIGCIDGACVHVK